MRLTITFINFIFELIHSSYLPPNYNFHEDYYDYNDQAENILDENEVSSDISSPGLRHGIYNNCHDEKNNCDSWAEQGECEINPNYMLSNCRKSCGCCTGSSPPPSSHLHFKNQNDKCQTKEGKKCIFPFVYKGNTYDICTTVDSDNGEAWCAITVERNRSVPFGFWGDCRPGCPGYEGKRKIFLNNITIDK